MAELKVFLLAPINKNLELVFNQYYPTFFNNQEIINELYTITDYFYKNGFGTIQTEDSIYYYETIKPQNNNIEIFALFLCNPRYQKKIINELINNLNIMFNDLEFDENKLKTELKDKLDNLYSKYRFDEKNGGNTINWENSINSADVNEENEEGDGMWSKNIDSSKKENSYIYFRNDSQMFSVRDALKNFSVDESEFTSSSYKSLIANPSEKMILWKNLKKKYLIGSIILGVIIYYFVPLAIILFSRE